MLLTGANNQNLPDDAVKTLREFRDKNEYPALRYWVRKLTEVGWSQASVARALEIHRSSVRSLLNTGTALRPSTTRAYGLPLPEGPVEGLTLLTKAWSYSSGARPLDLRVAYRSARISVPDGIRLNNVHERATRVRRNTHHGAPERAAADELTEMIQSMYYRFVSIETIASKLKLTERAVRNRLPKDPASRPSSALKYTHGEALYVLVWPDERRRVWNYIAPAPYGVDSLAFDRRLFEISGANPHRVQPVALCDVTSELGWSTLGIIQHPTPMTRLIL